MTDNKKKRMSMLDNLATSGGPPTPSSMISASRPLRAARDAVDGHKVWELDPALIDDTRVADRLDPADVIDLRDSIEATGQTVPILVRRDTTNPDRYLLVYGRRRLEAVRVSEKVTTIKALIANLDDTSAIEAQITENMARRDLTFIEKALFAHDLLESGYGSQARVAEVLTVTKSAISMALGVINAVGPDLVRAIGPATGVGRPRWETFARAVETSGLSQDYLCDVALRARDAAEMALYLTHDGAAAGADPSVVAFDTVSAEFAAKGDMPPAPSKTRRTPVARALRVDGDDTGRVTRGAHGLRIELDKGPFADWIEEQAQDVISELHARWMARRKDDQSS